MKQSNNKLPGTKTSRKAREARLAKNLRDNLRRRKQVGAKDSGKSIPKPKLKP